MKLTLPTLLYEIVINKNYPNFQLDIQRCNIDKYNVICVSTIFDNKIYASSYFYYYKNKKLNDKYIIDELKKEINHNILIKNRYYN